jgi:hypothetical protein
VLIRREREARRREKKDIEKKKALLWSVTGIAASSFTLDLIQPLQDKAVSTIPFFVRYTPHKAMIEVNRRCKTQYFGWFEGKNLFHAEVELYPGAGGGGQGGGGSHSVAHI